MMEVEPGTCKGPKYKVIPKEIRDHLGLLAEDGHWLNILGVIKTWYPKAVPFSRMDEEMMEFWKRLLLDDLAYIRCHCLGHGPFADMECTFCALDVS